MDKKTSLPNNIQAITRKLHYAQPNTTAYQTTQVINARNQIALTPMAAFRQTLLMPTPFIIIIIITR